MNVDRNGLFVLPKSSFFLSQFSSPILQFSPKYLFFTIKKLKFYLILFTILNELHFIMSYCRQFYIKIGDNDSYIYNFPQTYSWNTIDSQLENLAEQYNNNIVIYPCFNGNPVEPSFDSSESDTDSDIEYDTDIE